MNNLLFGIVIGNFTYFAGERFLKFLLKALKVRRENEAKKVEETMKMMIDKVMGEVQKR